MKGYIVVNGQRYKELCADYLETKKKYKEALLKISELVEKLESKKKKNGSSTNKQKQDN